MTDFVTHTQLERLHELLQAKLQKLAAAPVDDADTALSREILMFVDFLVNKEIRINDELTMYPNTIATAPPAGPGAAPTYYWSTHTGNVLPYGKPSTICDNCWQNCNGKHTHCTHMILNDME